MMEAKAVARYVHQSPRKIRKTLDSMRGLKVGDALNQLHFSPEKAAGVIEKTLRSAVANLMSQNEESNIDPEGLGVKEAFVEDSTICVAAYRKKQEFSGGKIKLGSNVNCNGIPSYIQETSSLLNVNK